MNTEVAGVWVGCYKNRDLIEIDCPWCGRSHTLVIPEECCAPITCVVTCTGCTITLTGICWHQPVPEE